MVAGVRVMVLDEHGKVVEKGDCEALRTEGLRGEGDWWEYVPTAEGKLAVEVYDLAGNVVKKELVSGS
jgi:hypothetical protein